MKSYNYLWLVFLTIVASCASPKHIKKKEKIIQEMYSSDTIVMQNYMFYHDVTNSWDKVQDWTHQLSGDSVVEIFKTSLSKLSLNIDYKKYSTNNVDSTFHQNWRKPFDHCLQEKIYSLAKDKSEIQLVPLIKITNNYQSGMYFTSSGAAGGSRYLMRGKVYLIIYLIKNNSIIYSRSGLFLSDLHPAYDMKEVMHTLTQQDWDELVALVMKDYLDRLEDGTEMNKLD